ncbi:TetR/AcrR family transcriptional regulator [Lactobacillus sp. LL6]|uniref:TetR/AcrR family transcriptional regulator n=1 Tax=Lactobacillus sp. LL6 TaxID=2596827 RepID=UPI001186C63E|nr:TetR/AcrR family transcriptional regulator [Lactobacillus sp. LL6]TSO26184.1 TetR/AcrR family transcriptional regulator [Lactobacillus sp. LL6]
MDIRVTNTKNRIQQGLLKCMEEKPFREIYSRDVIKKAEISSRTFYHYYSNKNEVLDDTEDELVSGLKKAMEEDRSGVKRRDHFATSEEIIHDFEEDFKATINFYIINKSMVLTLLSENGDIGFLKKIYKTTENEILTRIKLAYGSDKKIKQDHNFLFSIALNNYVNSIINIISNLLQYDDKLSPHQIRHIVGKVEVNSPVQLMQDQF